MSKTKSLKIRCSNCGKWFDSPIYFGDIETFDSTTMEGNMVQCKYCDRMTACNKENMKLSSIDGGFIGSETT
ncbi:hypothetical protein D7V67_15445 [Clostridium paraputrificum]|nr:hypothetical protein D7V67_15445 [Clostridium paraputrificum]